MSCRVLVVDDSRFMRLMLSEILKNAGCDVIEVDNGADAVSIYSIEKPDLVTMDILMPVQDGIETLQKIKQQDPDASVIMVTALGMDDYLERAMSYGASGCIIKPFSQEQVVQVLEHVTGQTFDVV